MATRPAVITHRPSSGVDALYAPRRTILDDLLVHARPRRRRGHPLRVRVTDVIERSDAVAGGSDAVAGVRADRGRRADPRAARADRDRSRRRRSTIARCVGAPALRVGQHLDAMTYGYWSDLETNGYEWTFRPNACSGIIPTNDGEACVFAAGSPGAHRHRWRRPHRGRHRRRGARRGRAPAHGEPALVRSDVDGTPRLHPPVVGTWVGARRRCRGASPIRSGCTG